MPKEINRSNVMQSYSVHNLTKDILTMSTNHDPVDAYHDVMLAAKVLKKEMDDCLGIQPINPTNKLNNLRNAIDFVLNDLNSTLDGETREILIFALSTNQ